MLSHRLLETIDGHCREITMAAADQIKRTPELPHAETLPRGGLQHWGCRILLDFGNWLLAGKDPELIRRYEKLGRLSFEESIVLSEAVHTLQILKDRLIDFARAQSLDLTAFDIYVEEEFEHLVGHFFDWLVYHVIRGYEAGAKEISQRVA